MFDRDVLEFAENKIIYDNGKNKKVVFTIDQISRIKLELRLKNVLIIVRGEKVYIDEFVIPRVKRRYINRLIQDRLKYKFKTIDDIMFCSNVTSNSDHNLCVKLFCINLNCRDLIEKFTKNKINIKGIVPIQWYASQKYRDSVKVDNYFLPKWYMDNRKNKINKRIKILIVICLILNMFFTGIFIFMGRKIETLKLKANQISKKYSIYSMAYNEKHSKEFDSTQTFFELVNIIKNYGDFRNINIEGRSSSLEFIGDSKRFSQFIESMEKHNEFDIENIVFENELYNSMPEEGKRSQNANVWNVEIKYKGR